VVHRTASLTVCRKSKKQKTTKKQTQRDKTGVCTTLVKTCEEHNKQRDGRTLFSSETTAEKKVLLNKSAGQLKLQKGVRNGILGRRRKPRAAMPQFKNREQIQIVGTLDDVFNITTETWLRQSKRAVLFDLDSALDAHCAVELRFCLFSCELLSQDLLC